MEILLNCFKMLAHSQKKVFKYVYRALDAKEIHPWVTKGLVNLIPEEGNIKEHNH